MKGIMAEYRNNLLSCVDMEDEVLLDVEGVTIALFKLKFEPMMHINKRLGGCISAYLRRRASD